MDVPTKSIASTALRRLNALSPLDDAAIRSVMEAAKQPRVVQAHREIIAEATPIASPLLIAHGWAARIRVFQDGRRQILSLLLPGDLIGNCQHPAPCAVSTIVALTELTVLRAPPAATSEALHRAYAVSEALDEAYLLAHIARLGRMSAHERVADLLLELRERLQLAGLADHNSFDLPLTQEKLADLLGLTAVHVNRMVKVAREAGEVTVKSGRVALTAPADLARMVGRTPTRVTAS